MAIAPIQRSIFQQALFEDDNESGYFTGLGRGDPFALRRLGGGQAPIYGQRWSPGSTFGMFGVLPVYGTEDIVPIQPVIPGTDTSTTTLVQDYDGDGDVEVDDTAAYYDTAIVDSSIIGDSDGDGFVDVYDEDALLDLYNDENVADVITGIGGPEGQDVIIAASDPSDMLYESGQDLQAFNPDINYDDAFVSDLTNQYVGTIGPDSFSDTTQAVAEAQDFPLDQFDDGVYSASDFPVGSSFSGTDYVSDYSTDVFSAGDTFANPQGSIVDIGYGIGEVDPALATAAGYTTAVADPEPTTIPEMIGDAIGTYIESGGMLGMIANELFGDEPYIGPTGFVNPHSNVGGIETVSSDGGQIAVSELPDATPDYDASSEVTPFTSPEANVSDFVAGLENYQLYGDPLGEGTIVTPDIYGIGELGEFDTDPVVSSTTGMVGVDESGNLVEYGTGVNTPQVSDFVAGLENYQQYGDPLGEGVILEGDDRPITYGGSFSSTQQEIGANTPFFPEENEEDDGLSVLANNYTDALLNLTENIGSGNVTSQTEANAVLNLIDPLLNNDYDGTMSDEEIESLLAPELPTSPEPDLSSMSFGYDQDTSIAQEAESGPTTIDTFVGGDYEVASSDPIVAFSDYLYGDDDAPAATPIPEDNEAFIEDVLANPDNYVAPTVPETDTPELDLTTGDDGGTQPSDVTFGYDEGEVDPGFADYIPTTTTSSSDDDGPGVTYAPDDNDDFINDVLTNTDDYLAPISTSNNDDGGSTTTTGGGGRTEAEIQKDINDALKDSGGEWTSELNDLVAEREDARNTTSTTTTTTTTTSNNDDGGNDSDTSSSSDSLCFLTTAIVNRRGEADDGPTLTKLRKFRDTYMASMPAEVEEYYDVAPRIVKAIPADHKDWDWVGEQIDEAVRHIDNKDGDKAYDTYKGMVLKLSNDWLEEKNDG